MPKGQRIYDRDQRLEIAYAELFGAIKQQIIFFSAENGIGTQWVAQRMAESLDPLGTRGTPGTVQHLRSGTGPEHHALAEVEVAERALGDGQAQGHPAEVQGDRGEAVKKSRQGGWGDLNEAERIESSIRRMKKRKDPIAQAMLRGLLKKRRALGSAKAVAAALDEKKARQKEAATKLKRQRDRERKREKQTVNRLGYPILTAEEQKAKQRLYQARSTARKKGQPLPDLPPALTSVA